MKWLSLLLFSLIIFSAKGQSGQKIGHADWEYIFNQMPEYKKIESELRAFEAQLQNQLKAKNQDLETKYKAYLALPADTPEPIKKDKESELSYLQEEIQKFQQEAQASMQKKQNALINPVFEKVAKAIEAVALENDYSYIINPQVVGGNDILLFASEKYNISNLVLKKLGVPVAQPNPQIQK
ncbi:MAG TPA: OmpH family outer membrane protein [Ohtaekwangia sp.]